MLTPRQETFAVGLAKGLTQSDAYRKAYPASLKWRENAVWVQASALAANREVSIRVSELTAKAAARNEVTVERVLKELARLAFFDIRKLVDDEGRPVPIQQLDEDSARAVVGLDVAAVGNEAMGVGQVLKVKMADKRAALEALGKHLKMFTDRIEVGASDELVAAVLAGRKRARKE